MKLFHIYMWKTFLLLFLYKYISIHTLLKSVMQLINIMHHRGIVSIIYYLSYFTDGFNRSCNECIKASLAVKVSSLPSPHLEEPPIACAMIHSLS